MIKFKLIGNFFYSNYRAKQTDYIGFKGKPATRLIWNIWMEY